uniref:Uncharacterized protein n=1 Tax=Romanomermis culicivorax TaxID=13658 RepID=A0A915IR25_ROMCU
MFKKTFYINYLHEYSVSLEMLEEKQHKQRLIAACDSLFNVVRPERAPERDRPRRIAFLRLLSLLKSLESVVEPLIGEFVFCNDRRRRRRSCNDFEDFRLSPTPPTKLWMSDDASIRAARSKEQVPTGTDG